MTNSRLTTIDRKEPLPLLAPFGALYLGCARLFHAAYDWRIRRATRVSVPVVSIGNVSVGGSGKTPVAEWISRELTAKGRRVAIVSRGYGGRRTNEPLLVSRESEIFATASEAGDEPWTLARSGCAHAVVVARDRRLAASLAIENDAEVIVMDDGFQHRRLHRDVDIVLLDATKPFGNRRGLPAGRLRESPRSIARADLILLTRAPRQLASSREFLDVADLPSDLSAVLSKLPPERRPPVAALAISPQRVRLPGGSIENEAWLSGRSILAVSGVARPAAFARSLTEAGAILCDHFAWPDHHRFTASDGERVADALRETGAELIVTTAKDHARWPLSAPQPAVLEVAVETAARGAIVSNVFRSIERRSQREG